MLVRAVATVTRNLTERKGVQELETEFGTAFNYIDLTGRLSPGVRVVLNRTAACYGLGTGGTDFVMARLDGLDQVPVAAVAPDGHIVKLRYTPVQHTVNVLEEDPANESIWNRDLTGFPVVVGQIHSQIAPIAAALSLRGLRTAYVMTDGAALPIALSRLVASLAQANMIATTITAGQAFGGDHETVTVHSALLAARHKFACDVAIVCQGPGNAGTGTKYGFSGIEQASLLDIVAALSGIPIAVVRASSADSRDRHRGISHHTLTALGLVRSRCIVALPPEEPTSALPTKHDVRFSQTCEPVLAYMTERVDVTTMGRRVSDDPLFFKSAAAAGLIAAEIATSNTRNGATAS